MGQGARQETKEIKEDSKDLADLDKTRLEPTFAVR